MRYIVWDVDEVLADMSTLFHQCVTRTHGSCDPVDNWTDYRFGRHIRAVGDDNVRQYMCDQRLIEQCLPLPEAYPALSLAYAMGYTNIFLTARGWHPDPEYATRRWCERHGLSHLVHQIIVVDRECKTERMLEYFNRDDIALFVEDSASNALKAWQHRVPAVLIRRPWNQANRAQLPNVDDALKAVYYAVELDAPNHRLARER